MASGLTCEVGWKKVSTCRETHQSSSSDDGKQSCLDLQEEIGSRTEADRSQVAGSSLDSVHLNKILPSYGEF